MRNILTLAILYLFTIVTFANATDHGSSTLPNILNTTLGNIGIGNSTLASVTSGNHNICFGQNACEGITTGSYNAVLGNYTVVTSEGLTTGSNNVFVGYGLASTGATTNAVGIGIGNFLGNDDIGIGNNALSSGTTGTGNIGIGTYALLVTSTGNNGVAIGYYSMNQATVSTANVGLGAYTGSTLTSGINNVMIGDHVASTTLTTGSYNILIGTSAAIDATTSSVSNEIHIGGTGGDWVKVTGANTNTTEATTLNGKFTTTGLISGGTKFTMTGCSATAAVGGATAGTYTSGTTGTCTVVITMNGATGLAAPTGWDCHASDRTTVADLQQTTTSSTTTATISGTTLSGDVVSFNCIGY